MSENYSSQLTVINNSPLRSSMSDEISSNDLKTPKSIDNNISYNSTNIMTPTSNNNNKNILSKSTMLQQELDDQNNNPLAKVIIAGAPAVGKTCILNRYSKKNNSTTLSKYEATIGADFHQLDITVAEKVLKLQVYIICRKILLL